ncbi:MAG: ribonuclease R [Patescibacteria group bacterium]|mgnify:CR=1 FL=1
MKQKTTNRLQGVISISSKGTGYVAIDQNKDKGNDPEIDYKHLNTALHGDTVEIVLHPKGHGRQTAEVSKIITRAKMSFAGVLEPVFAEASAGKETDKNIFFVKPDDTKMYTDILVAKEDLNNAKIGQKVFVEIVSWTDPRKAPKGRIVKVLGKPGENNAEMNAIVLEKGFDTNLPHNVEDEAKAIKLRGIKKEDYEGRKDFRQTLTFTIDPFDAKDFDDAISFKEVGDPAKDGVNYEVGIHIADVSYYVLPQSALDEEAGDRTTSVYLVDRTIPMLPEVLSNDLCSLVPNKDRLAMSAVFIVDKNAQIKNEWYGRTVINSQKRFTYEEAEVSIKKSGTPLHKELTILNNLAKKLNTERFEKGAISLEQEEVKFVLDKTGFPIKVVKKERGDSNKLIEEFMLLANRRVAEMLSKGLKKDNIKFIYRVHDNPSKEKMADLAFFLKSLGHKVSLKDGIIPTREINNLLKSLKGKNEENTVERAVVRSMAKAVYSTNNIGHYGLAFEYYTHFTSPIRRYPDIIVHRILNEYLKGAKVDTEKIGQLEEIAKVSSVQEKYASDAERASIKYKQVEYMSKKKGELFTGVISGITEWGMYVEEKETKCEGLVKVRDMNDDFYTFDEKKLQLVGQKKKKKYRLGDEVRIKVKEVDLEKKNIDYILV